MNGQQGQDRPASESDDGCWLCEGSGYVEANEGEEKIACPACNGTGKRNRFRHSRGRRFHLPRFGPSRLRFGRRGCPSGGRLSRSGVRLPLSVVPSEDEFPPLPQVRDGTPMRLVQEEMMEEAEPAITEKSDVPEDTYEAVVLDDTDVPLQLTEPPSKQSVAVTPTFELGDEGFSTTGDIVTLPQAELNPLFEVTHDLSGNLPAVNLDLHQFTDPLNPIIDYDVAELDIEPGEPLGPPGIL